MKIDDKLVISLLQNVGLDNSVFQLLLKDKIFLFESFQGIKLAIRN